MDLAFWILCGVSWLIALVCLFRLWRRKDRLIVRLVWSLLLLVPILGPLFYAGFYRPPPVQSEDLRAPFEVSRHAGV